MKKTFNMVGPISLPYCPGTICFNWDSLRPEYLNDKRTGHTIGRLMPRISLAVLRASPGIAAKSIPDHDTRVLASQRYTPIWGALTTKENQHENLD